MNLKKLTNPVDVILILQNEMLLLMLFCKRVLKQREAIERYGKTINNSLLGTVCFNFLFDITVSDAKQLSLGCRGQLGQKDTDFDVKVSFSFKPAKWNQKELLLF